MSSIGDVKSLYSVSGNTFDERRQNIVDSKVAAAELVATGKADVKTVSDALGISPSFVQHYANQFKEMGLEEFRKSVNKEEETAQKGIQGFLKKLLDDFKKAVEGN